VQRNDFQNNDFKPKLSYQPASSVSDPIALKTPTSNPLKLILKDNG
jgi:hypothetical protein